MSAVGAPVPAAPPPGMAPTRESVPRQDAAARTPAARIALRVAALFALGLFAALHWGTLVTGASGARMAAATLLGVAGGLAVHALGLAIRTRALRAGAVAGLLLGLVALGLLLSGMPASLLAPRGWPDALDGIGQGIAALPNLLVPYRGVDPWPRVVVLGGGVALLVAAGLAALWPRSGQRVGRPGLAVGLLTVLFAVPVVERNLDAQFARGAAFALLLIAFVWLDRIEAQLAVPALGLAAAAVLAAAILAPRLDAGRPWVDYERLAGQLASARTVSFDWNQRYGPITWEQDGRVVLRIKARHPAYWKTETLDTFDGLRWLRTGAKDTSTPPASEMPTGARARPEWTQRVRVTVRALRSTDVVGAGTTLAVLKLGRRVQGASTAGTFTVVRPLEAGDSYEAVVNTPQPSSAQLRSDSSPYPSFARDYLDLLVPVGPHAREKVPSGRADVGFPEFGTPSATEPSVYGATGGIDGGDRVMRSSVYGRAYALAQRLALQSATPYQFVRSVQAYLAKGFRYDEHAARRAVPLEDFLFRDRAGYCQQFSGAMALLLRMGGVPARVATGFTSGVRDPRRGEYVVRDTDAHSWVEAYFPRYGWVAFDPTPPVAPALVDDHAHRPGGSAASGGPAPVGPRAAEPRVALRGGSGSSGGGLPWGWLIVAGLCVGGLLAAGAAAVSVRRRRPPRPLDPWLAELEQALSRTGRSPTAAATLVDLERRLAASPGAVAYVRAVRRRRFADPGAPAPSAQARRALRARLADGLGPTGRLRSWWALPPRRPSRRA